MSSTVLPIFSFCPKAESQPSFIEEHVERHTVLMKKAAEKAKEIFHKYIIPLAAGALVGYSFVCALGPELAEIVLSVAMLAAYPSIISLHLIAPRYSPYLWYQGVRFFDPRDVSSLTVEEFEKKFPKYSSFLKKVYEKPTFLDRLTGLTYDSRMKEHLNTFKRFSQRVIDLSKKGNLATPPLIAIKDGRFSGVGQGLSGISKISSSVLATGLDHFVYDKSYEVDFTIGHELMHIKNRDAQSIIPYFTGFIAGSTALGFAIDLLAQTFFIPIALQVLTYIICQIAFLYILMPLSRAFEKRADLEGVETLGAARGAIADFKSSLKAKEQYIQDLEKGSLWNRASRKFWYDAKGNHRFLCFHPHPPLSERIRYLKEWEQNRIAKRIFPMRVFEHIRGLFW